MTKITKIAACLLFLGALMVMGLQGPAVVSADNTASAGTGTTILIDLEITHVQALSYGFFAPPGTGDGVGTIKVEADGTGSVVSTNVALFGITGVGWFTVQGEPNTQYKMDTGSAIQVTLTRAGGSETMIADLEFYSETRADIAFPNAIANGGELSGTGADRLFYGGVLNIGENQVPGGYTGTFPVVLNY